ncbi:hypothetical protein MBLNU457_5585t2 [Dothideomycetes sp. NU457]
MTGATRTVIAITDEMIAAIAVALQMSAIVSSSQAVIETGDVMTAFQDTTTIPQGETALATENVLVRDPPEEIEDIAAVTELAEIIEMIHVSVDVKKAAADDERKKAERQAKLAIWKKKQEEKKAAETAASSPRQLSMGNDTAAASPSTAASPAPSATTAPISPEAEDGPAKPYAGKFDPKAIAKRAAAASQRLKNAATLEDNAAIPGKSKSTTSSLTNGHAPTDNSKKPSQNAPVGGALKSTKSASEAISQVFGLNQTANEQQPIEQSTALDMGEEQVERKKLERLPMPELENTGDTALANAQEDQDDGDWGDDGFLDGEDDEAQAAAARAAAEKRAAAMTEAGPTDRVEDVTPTPAVQDDTVMGGQDKEEIDPLDAFMSGLNEQKRPNPPKSRRPAMEPKLMFSDDEDNMEAVGDIDDDELAAVMNKKKKKELPTVDHSKVEYEPFRKNFYVEPQELQELDAEGVKSLRFELDDIKVQGANVPKPVQKFAQFGLGSQVLDIIRDLGFEKPTSIQAQAIPAIMSGRDVIGVAKTGSGKTVTFLLPMFRHIKDQRPLEKMDGPIGMILAPTRELATQIHKECKPYLKALDLRAVCAYGGAPIKDQIAELKRGAEIVVCTPGRIIDLLTANQGRVINLRRITYLVLDEADRMFDMGFEPQITKLNSLIRPDRQTVLFSATFSRQMETLARRSLHKPVQIVVGGRSIVAPEIKQVVEIINEAGKWPRTLGLLGDLFTQDEDARALIFVERQEKADSLLLNLQKAGYPCVSIHGGREQIDRDTAIDDFKRGDVPIMIATSVAARGLDVKQLKLVINFDVPSHLEDYVHRSGRTGRAGNTGTAVTFICEDQPKFSVDIVKALEQSEQPVPEELKKMANDFMEQVKTGKAKAANMGFSGKGLEKLDAARDAEKMREKRAYRTGDEPDEEDEKEKKEETEEKKEEKIDVKSRDTPAEKPSTALPGVPKGIDLDAVIKVHKTEVPKAVDNRHMSARERAAAAAANVNNRLGARSTTRSGVPIDNKGPDAGAYHATLEINDFPQKARWAVTNRTNVAKVLETTGVSITSKGNFYPPGQVPSADDAPKLYLLVEADSENQVTQAMRELQRLLKEGVIAASETENRAPVGGRYSVVT